MANSERKKDSLGARLCKNLDISPDLLPRGSLVEIRGQRAVNVRGCGRILCYTEETVRLALSDGALEIRGEELICTSYYPGAVGIEGRIFSVNFNKVGD